MNQFYVDWYKYAQKKKTEFLKFDKLWNDNDKWNTQLTGMTCCVFSAVSHNILNLYILIYS